MRLVIINRYFPPDAWLTGESALELAEYLVGKGVDVTFVTVSSTRENSIFGDQQRYSSMKGIEAINVVSIKPLYNGKNKILRLVNFSVEGYRLIRKSLTIPADAYVVMTQPALLNMWANILYSKKYNWIFWSMDLYPEVFASGGRMSKTNIFYKIAEYFTYRNPPNHLIALGDFQLRYLESKFGKQIQNTILPAGIYDADSHSKKEISEIEKLKNGKIVFAYCGNLGPQHSADFLVSLAKKIDGSKALLVVSIFGPKWSNTIKLLKQYDCVVQLDYQSRHELEHIDIHVSSLNENWTNVCVPSKTVSAVCSGNAILYCGSKNSDNWMMFEKAGWRICPNRIEEQLEEYFENFSLEQLKSKSEFAKVYRRKLLTDKRLAFDNILMALKNISVPTG